MVLVRSTQEQARSTQEQARSRLVLERSKFEQEHSMRVLALDSTGHSKMTSI